MAEELVTVEGDKTTRYESLLPQLEALTSYESDPIANMANITAALKEQFGWLWVGFYIVKEKELVVGPFQGPIACTRIQKGKGVCGTAWQNAATVIVPDVELFTGHIACSSLSRSEIVVPVFKGREVVAILDVDSILLNDFDTTDQLFLEKVAALIRL